MRRYNTTQSLCDICILFIQWGIHRANVFVCGNWNLLQSVVLLSMSGHLIHASVRMTPPTFSKSKKVHFFSFQVQAIWYQNHVTFIVTIDSARNQGIEECRLCNTLKNSDHQPRVTDRCAVLKIEAICHVRDLWKLARYCKQLHLLCQPDPWNLPGTALLSEFQSSWWALKSTE